jgi:AcrR family transcriptional regulator
MKKVKADVVAEGSKENEPRTTSRERLLDAAEQLFAEFGFNGVSVRKIVDVARVNLGAIPYHFGTKEELFREVLLRRAGPLRDLRRQLLAELFARNPTPSLEEVLWVLIEPAFRTNRENDAFRKLLGRASTDPAPEVRRMLAEVYSIDFMTVPKTLREQLKDLDETEFFWKLNCFYAVMLFVQADTGKIQTIAGQDFDTSQPAVALKYVVPFLAAGLRAKIEE